MPNFKLWLKNRLERIIFSSLSVNQEVLKKAPPHELEIIIPHRTNWPLTTATVGAFERLTTGDFGITVVANVDEVPPGWSGLQNPRITLVRNRVTFFGRLFRLIFPSENGSMSNAIAIESGLRARPDARWAIVAHNDSAPLRRGWNENFFEALGSGLVIGSTRDEARVFAAHSAGTLFNAQEFRRRGGSPWPTFRFGQMVRDVGDGITEVLHDQSSGKVPVLPNNRQEPTLTKSLSAYPLLNEFAENGTHVSFSADRKFPIYAHLGRGTPRSKADPSMAHKLPVDRWIELLNTLS
ncbi:MAG: hypothetical protein ACXVCS_06300 [Bdellovibrionota bacterium]